MFRTSIILIQYKLFYQSTPFIQHKKQKIVTVTAFLFNILITNLISQYYTLNTKQDKMYINARNAERYMINY